MKTLNKIENFVINNADSYLGELYGEAYLKTLKDMFSEQEKINKEKPLILTEKDIMIKDILNELMVEHRDSVVVTKLIYNELNSMLNVDDLTKMQKEQQAIFELNNLVKQNITNILFQKIFGIEDKKLYFTNVQNVYVNNLREIDYNLFQDNRELLDKIRDYAFCNVGTTIGNQVANTYLAIIEDQIEQGKTYLEKDNNLNYIACDERVASMFNMLFDNCQNENERQFLRKLYYNKSILVKERAEKEKRLAKTK